MSQGSYSSSGHLEFYLHLQSTSLLVHWIHCPNPKAQVCLLNQLQTTAESTVEAMQLQPYNLLILS